MDWILEEVADLGEWQETQQWQGWQRTGTNILADEWRVKVVSRGLPGHACCSWRDLFLSPRRNHSDCVWEVGRKGKKAKRTEGMHNLLSALGFQQKDHPQTSGTPPALEDPPTGLWAHPNHHVLSTYHPQLCNHPFFPSPPVFMHILPTLLSSGKRNEKLVL